MRFTDHQMTWNARKNIKVGDNFRRLFLITNLRKKGSKQSLISSCSGTLHVGCCHQSCCNLLMSVNLCTIRHLHLRCACNRFSIRDNFSMLFSLWCFCVFYCIQRFIVIFLNFVFSLTIFHFFVFIVLSYYFIILYSF